MEQDIPMSRLRSIVGKSVTFARQVEGYWQFGFGKSTLTVIVPFRVVPLGDERCASQQSTELDVAGMMVGKEVKSVALTDVSVDVELETGTRLLIDLRPENFICPEGLVFSEDGYPTEVWQ